MTSRGKEKARGKRKRRKGNKRRKRHLQDVSNFHCSFSHLIFLPNVELTGSRPTVESKDVWHLDPDPPASPTAGGNAAEQWLFKADMRTALGVARSVPNAN